MLALACNAIDQDAQGDELLIQFQALLALALASASSKSAGLSDWTFGTGMLAASAHEERDALRAHLDATTATRG